MKNGILITGIGIVTPLGSSREQTWQSLLAGKSGIRPTKEGWEARVGDFSPNGARSRMGDFAVLAAAEALRHAGFFPGDVRGRNIGCAVSQSKPIISEIPVSQKNMVPLLESQLLLSSFFGWSAESVVQREFGLEGPTANVVAACATGVASIQTASRWIEAGLCDIVLAGAAESSLNDFYRAGFRQMGVLAGEGGAKPFDRQRTGFVMGEGAAVMVLESERSAGARGQEPVARLLKATLRQSGLDALRFDAAGDSVASLISRTIQDFAAPDYINAHGTATLFNDLAETRGIKKSLKGKWEGLPVSSTKAATGHLLGAAGAVEAAFAALALRDQIVPATLNLTDRDPECNLDYVPGPARRAALSSAMSLSYGFGGQMGAVLFGKAG